MPASVRSFLLRCASFALLLIAVLTLISVFGPHLQRADYLGAIRAKHARLDSLPSPRLIITGGSNTAFGVNSAAVGRALGMPVVNMGMQAGLGYRFIVKEVENELRQGDVLLVLPEMQLFEYPDSVRDVAYFTVDRYPEAWCYMPTEQLPKVAATYAVKKLQALVGTGPAVKGGRPDPIYRADGFNAEGDLITHLGLPGRRIKDRTRIPDDGSTISPRFWRITKDLEARAAAHGARVLFGWPAQMASVDRPRLDSLIADRFSKAGIAIVGQAKEHVYPDERFFDTKYHLDSTARTWRTERLIADLKAVLR